MPAEASSASAASVDIPQFPAPDSSSGAILEVPTSTGSVLDASGSILEVDAYVETGSTIVDSVIVEGSPARVVVTEVMWMGSDRSTADEWVELGGFSSGAVSLPRSLSGWTLATVKAGAEIVIARLPDLTISSGSAIVIANYPADASRLAIEPTLVTTGMSLPNTQLLLRLRDGSGALVDEVDDGVGAPMAGANPSGGPKASMERVDPWSSGAMPSSWRTAVERRGFDEGVPIYGTPGYIGVASAESEASGGSGTDPNVPVEPIAVPPAIRFSELLANPAGVDDDEWLEITAFSGSTADLTDVDIRTGTVRFSLSGTLGAGEYRRYGKLETGIPLPNVGGTVELLWRDRPVDAWTYVETVEGVSLGRSIDGTAVPLCAPSPGIANDAVAPDPLIEVQSSSASVGKLSLNLHLTMPNGSLAGASCSWVYPDGYASASCNPPSHAIVGPVFGDVIVSVRDYCGNTMVRTMRVGVPGKSVPKEPGPVCVPSAFTGVTVSEVFPNPVGDEAAGEWIELRNDTAEDKPLCGWSLDDGKRGSDPYPLDRWRLPPGERLVLPRSETKIALNNDADAVRLTAPSRLTGSETRQIVRYANAPEDASWAERDDGVWAWTTVLTPGAANVFPGVRWQSEEVLRIVSALPNPVGKDGPEGETVTVRNLTPYPLPLTGWTIRSGEKTSSLDGIVLSAREQKILTAPTLRNTDGLVSIEDRDGVTRSELAWATAKDGEEIVAPEVVAHVSGLSLVSSDDCVHWYAVDADGNTASVLIDGIVVEENFNCLKYVLDLHENKKYEQKIYNNGAVSLSVDGNDLGLMLVREGLALAGNGSPFEQVMKQSEAKARAERRGIWSDDARVAIIEESRKTGYFRSILSTKGLVVTPSVRSGIVESGTVLSFSTNVPASIEIAVNAHDYVPYDGPIAISDDAEVYIRAFSDIQTASGYSVVRNSIQSYAIRKNRYPTILVSEVYPHPKSGEKEWVELWNPTGERVSLTGWMLDDVADTGSKPWAFPAGSVIEPGERRVFSGSSVAFNDGGDDVRLIDPNGRVSDAVSYASVKAGRSVAVSFGAFGTARGSCLTTTVTPGSDNRCSYDLPSTKAAKLPRAIATTFEYRMPVRYRNAVGNEPAAFVRVMFGSLLGNGTYSAVRSRFLVLSWIAVLVLAVLLLRRHRGIAEKHEK